MVSWVAQMLIIDIIYTRLAVKDFDNAVRRIQKSATSLLNQHLI
jgi:DNA-binding MurR/RpiR family transcriptional regulator